MNEQKSVFITYNQAYHPLILRILKRLSLHGYTSWDRVLGAGSRGGDPHLGSHAWPEMNAALITIVPSDKVSELLQELRKLDEATPEQGLRAFVWNIEASI